MIRCPNCSSVLPQREGLGLKQCPQCQCDLTQSALPPLPGFDLETSEPAQRSQTLFGLSSVGQLNAGITQSQGFPIPEDYNPQSASPQEESSFTGLPPMEVGDELPGLPGISDKLPSAGAPDSVRKPTGTSRHHVIDFGHSDDASLDGNSDLPALSLDLPTLGDLPAQADADLPGAPVDLPALSASLPAAGSTLPAVGSTLPAVGGTLPAVSSTLPSPSRGEANMPQAAPPSGSARYQRPSSRRAPQAAASMELEEPRLSSEQPPAANNAAPEPPPPKRAANPRVAKPNPANTRSMLKRALARQVPNNEDFLPGIEDLDLDLEPASNALEGPNAPQAPQAPQAPKVPPPNANVVSGVLPADLPETVAALDLGSIPTPEPITETPRAANAASPAPKAIQQNGPRWPMLAGASLLLVAAAGAGLWQLGMLDGLIPQDSQAQQEAGPSFIPTPAKPSPDDPKTLQAAASKLSERSAPVLKALRADNPLNAETLAQAQGDRLGAIEAALYYAVQNSDPRQSNHPALLKASAPLDHWQKNSAPFVQRVLALREIYSGRPQRAQRRLAQIVAAPKGSSDDLAQLYAAIATHRQGKIRESIKAVQALALRAPDLKRAELLSRIWTQDLPNFAQVKNNIPAWEGLVAQVNAGDAPASHAYNVAKTLFDQGYWKQASEVAKTYLDQATIPKDQQRWKTLKAELLQARGQYEAAQAVLQGVLKKDPHDKAAASLLWDQLFENQQHKKLRSELNAWLSLHPNDLHARIMQARTLAAQGDGSLALLFLAQIDQHLLSGGPLAAPLVSNSDAPESKKRRAQAEGLPAERLMAISPALSKLPSPKRELAAESAHARAEILARRTAIKAAIPAFEMAQELSPLQIRSAQQQAKLLAKSNQLPRAMAVLEGARARLNGEVAPQAKRARAQLIATQAQLAFNAGKIKKARRRLAQAHALSPLDPNIELQRASLLLKIGQESMAEASFRKVMDRTGGVPGLLTPLSQIYLRQGQLDKLSVLLDPKLREENASIDLLISGARLRIAQNQLMPALELATRALKRAPENWEAHLVKAQILVARGDLESAQAELLKSRPKEPEPKYELWLGKIKDAQGNFEAAYGHYRLAASLDRSNYEPRVLQAKILARRGNAKKAISMLKPMLRKGHGTEDVFLAMGIAHRDLRKAKKAVAFFKRAQAKAPHSFVAFYEEGRIASNHNQHAQVIRSLSKALAANSPAMPARLRLDALRRLGRSHIESGDSNRAEEALSRYLIEAPRNDPGRAAVMRMMDSL